MQFRATADRAAFGFGALTLLLLKDDEVERLLERARSAGPARSILGLGARRHPQERRPVCLEASANTGGLSLRDHAAQAAQTSPARGEGARRSPQAVRYAQLGRSPGCPRFCTLAAAQLGHSDGKCNDLDGFTAAPWLGAVLSAKYGVNPELPEIRVPKDSAWTASACGQRDNGPRSGSGPATGSNLRVY